LELYWSTTDCVIKGIVTVKTSISSDIPGMSYLRGPLKGHMGLDSDNVKDLLGLLEIVPQLQRQVRDLERRVRKLEEEAKYS
jgi:hypothetical protein